MLLHFIRVQIVKLVMREEESERDKDHNNKELETLRRNTTVTQQMYS